MATSRNVRRRLIKALGMSKATFDAWDIVLPNLDTLPNRRLIESLREYTKHGVPPAYVAGCEKAGYHGIYDSEYILGYHASGVPIPYIQAARQSEARAHSFIAEEILRYHAAGIGARHAFAHPLELGEFFCLLGEGIPASYISALATAGHNLDSIRDSYASGLAIEYATAV